MCNVTRTCVSRKVLVGYFHRERQDTGPTRTLSRFKSFSPARKCFSKEAIHEVPPERYEPEEKGAFPECAMRSWAHASQKFSPTGTKARTKARHGRRARSRFRFARSLASGNCVVARSLSFPVELYSVRFIEF